MSEAAASPGDVYDIETPDAVEVRFDIHTLDYRDHDATAVLSMPVSGMTNPLTGAPTIAPLALLVDDAGSTATFARRGGRWPVTTELALDLHPDCMAIIGSEKADTVLAHARITGSTAVDALATCTLKVGARIVGEATLRSVYISVPAVLSDRPSETLPKTTHTSLAELMAIAPRSQRDSSHILAQLADPMLLNAMGNVHGGVAATGLELVATAAISTEAGARRLRTGSIRANFLRPLIAGPDSRYEGTAVNVGSTVGLADARAVGDDGRVAVIARVTTYR
jgi:uncharacterized protein (TIGR00369 family)